MYDVVGMRVLERERDVTQDRRTLGERHRFARGRGPRHPRAERLALHERHTIVGQVTGTPGGQHRDDARVLQSRRELRFPGEPVGAQSLRELRFQHLHHDAPAECDLLGHEDARHASATQLALDAVLAAEEVVEAVAKVGCGRQVLWLRGWSRGTVSAVRRPVNRRRRC